MKLYLPSWRSLVFVLFYLLVLLYTLTFPTTVSWFIVYAFTFVLLAAFLSARVRVRFRDIHAWVGPLNKASIQIQLSNHYPLPFLLSSLKLTVYSPSDSKTIETSVFFKRSLHAEFDSLPLPRGRYDRLELKLEAYGLFGLFRHRSLYDLPVKLDIYPLKLSDMELFDLLEIHAVKLPKDYSFSHHEFQVKEIRRYQSRDPLSNIDWKSSLKQQRWMIKEYDHEEVRPFDLYFIGFSSSDFETLLRLTYSLYEHLSRTRKVAVHLIGEFEGSTEMRRSKQDFLMIQPSTETDTLNQLTSEFSSTPENSLIIKPEKLDILLPLNQTQSSIILTEEHLFSLKGGKSQ